MKNNPRRIFLSTVHLMKKKKAILDDMEEKTLEKNGTNYEGFAYTLTDKDIKALQDNKVLALNLEGEYVVFLQKEVKK